MRRVLASALALSAALPAEGQFMRSMMSLRGSSGSFMSSSTWFQGPDGHMHHKVEEQRTDTTHSELGTTQTNEKIVCKDGHCHKETMTMMTPGMPVPNGAAMPMPEGMPCPMRQRMRAMMASLMGMAPPPGFPTPPQPHPRLVIFAAPSLRGARAEEPPAVQAASLAQAQAMPVPHYKPSAMTRPTPLGALALAGLCLSATGLLALLRHLHSAGAASAREPMLRSLGQPLAPIPEGIEEESPTSKVAAVPVMMAPPAREGAAAAAKGFLSGVYARAQAHVEDQAIRTYLASVYARAA